MVDGRLWLVRDGGPLQRLFGSRFGETSRWDRCSSCCLEITPADEPWLMPVWMQLSWRFRTVAHFAALVLLGRIDAHLPGSLLALEINGVSSLMVLSEWDR
ncbi:hypothetical protein ACLOJK_004486 [Asimina triloba]